MQSNSNTQGKQHPQAHLFETICFLGGGTYRGVQRGDKSIGLESLVLFNSTKSGSTLALPISKLTASAVRASIQASDAMFEKFAEGACKRIYSHFSQRQAQPTDRFATAAA